MYNELIEYVLLPGNTIEDAVKHFSIPRSTIKNRLVRMGVLDAYKEKRQCEIDARNSKLSDRNKLIIQKSLAEKKNYSDIARESGLSRETIRVIVRNLPKKSHRKKIPICEIVDSWRLFTNNV